MLMRCLALCLVLSACADDRSWRNRDPARNTQQHWERDQYICARENTHATVATVGGRIYSEPTLDEGMAEQCMRVRGWYVVRR